MDEAELEEVMADNTCTKLPNRDHKLLQLYILLGWCRATLVAFIFHEISLSSKFQNFKTNDTYWY